MNYGAKTPFINDTNQLLTLLKKCDIYKGMKEQTVYSETIPDILQNELYSKYYLQCFAGLLRDFNGVSQVVSEGGKIRISGIHIAIDQISKQKKVAISLFSGGGGWLYLPIVQDEKGCEFITTKDSACYDLFNHSKDIRFANLNSSLPFVPNIIESGLLNLRTIVVDNQN
jgi:hypothetical protein